MTSEWRQRIPETEFLRATCGALALALGLALPSPMGGVVVAAGGHRTFEPELVYLLPVYCRYTQVFRKRLAGGDNAAEIKRWTRKMGDVFIHMHHYCFGLMDQKRALFLSETPQERTHNLGISISEFDYVIQRAPQEFYLLPEILTKKGESLTKLGRGGAAALEFQQAIRLKPDYWQAYAGMSDHYRVSGDIEKARQWLRDGLAAAPAAQGLRRKLAELERTGEKGGSSGSPAQKSAAPARSR